MMLDRFICTFLCNVKHSLSECLSEQKQKTDAEIVGEHKITEKSVAVKHSP